MRQTEIFAFLGHFLPFQPPDNPKNQNFKIEKNNWRYYHFTHLHHNWQPYGVWFMRYGAQETEFFVILDCFFPFYLPMDPENQNLKKMKNLSRYHHFTNVYRKWQSYDVWFLRYGVQRTEFFVILGRFLSFYPPNNPKNQNFEKIKKPPGDIIILHMCTINDSHMMYGSWDMECDGQKFLSFWTVSYPFTPLTTRKTKFWKNEKNT